METFLKVAEFNLNVMKLRQVFSSKNILSLGVILTFSYVYNHTPTPETDCY